MNASQGSLDDKDIFRSCYALILFGVPNRGLEITGLRSMVQGQPNEDLVRDLRTESSFLKLLYKGFYDTFHEDSQIISIYETKKTHTVAVSICRRLLLSEPLLMSGRSGPPKRTRGKGLVQR